MSWFERLQIVLFIASIIALIMPYPKFSDSSSEKYEEVLSISKLIALAILVIMVVIWVFKGS